MNLDYTKVTHEQLLDQFRNRIVSDPKFKDLSAASIFQLYMEMITGNFDMLHFYLGRVAEEMFLDTAKQDSSIIKLSKNLGYNPKRPIPATAEIAVKLTGPLPANAAAGDVIWFNNEATKLKFNNHEFVLDRCYSYTLTTDDVINGKESSWSKIIRYSVPNKMSKDGFVPIVGNEDKLSRIKVVQCSIKTAEIYAIEHAENIGKSYQFYDIDDLKFSNYYGIRDPFAYTENVYTPLAGWCKVGISTNKTNAFNETNLCDIEIENVYCNSKVKALNDELSQTVKLNVCRIESNYDKTVRITFGDGNLVNNGFNNEDEILYVQYVATDGYVANTPDVIDSTLDCSSSIMAHGPGKVYDVTPNVTFVLTSNISNGADFESQLSMKNNAAVYFAARGQLINKKDFNAYFSALSKPIQVKNAIAWNTADVRATTDASTFTTPLSAATNNSSCTRSMSDMCDNARDAVYYTVIGDLYESLGNDKYKVKEFYTEENDASVVGTASLYNSTTTFNNHLVDLAYSVMSSQMCHNLAINQATSKDDPFFINTYEINEEINEKLPFGVVPISLTPIIHYYDLVGTVEMNRLANAADFQTSVESSVYKWLSDSQKFNNEIYKSDIVKLFYDNPMTKSVNLDITPSALIYSNDTMIAFTGNAGLSQATNDKYNQAYVTSVNGFTNNVIVVPAVAGNSTHISKSYLESLLNVSFGTVNTGAGAKKVSIKSVTELSDGRFMITLQDGYYDFGISSSTTQLFMFVPAEQTMFFVRQDFTSKAQILISAIVTACGSTYGNQITTTKDRPVNLPYAAYASPVVQSQANNTYVHGETFVRRANSKYSAFGLTEKGFNLAFAAQYLQGLCGSYSEAAAQYLQAYRVLKFAIEDSVLDDNNNIVNYTLPNEISVIRIKVNYTYGR